MKKLFIGPLLIVSICTYAQKKGDNTIQLDTSISLMALKSILFKNGYTVENNDTSFLYTSAKAMKHLAVVKLFIARTDTGIILKGQQKITGEISLFGIEMKEQFEQIEWTKKRNNLYSECWEEINKIALKIYSQPKYYKQ